jgi:O-antigen/teichoic acid export membrane protein
MNPSSDEAAPHRVIGRASLVAAGTTYQQGVSLVAGLLVARVIGAADYGIFVLARSLLDITGILTRLGLDIGLQRYFGETRNADPAQRAAVLRRVRMVAGAAALLPPIALALGLGGLIEEHVYRHPHFAQVLLTLALGLPFLTDIAVLGGAYRGILKLAPSVLTESIIMPSLRLAVIVVLFSLGWRLWAVVVGTSLAAFAASLFLAWRARADFTGPPARQPPWPDALHVVSYSAVLALAALVTTMTGTIDTLTLGSFASARDLGQYSLVKMLLLQMGIGAAAIGQGLGALVAERHFRGDNAAVVQVLAQNARWITLVTLPIFAVFLFWGAKITLLFGASYSIQQPVIDWLATSQYVFLVFAPCGWALSMTGKHVLELKILSLGLALSAIACWAAVPAYGQMGAAVATFAAMVLANVVRILFVRSSIGALPFRGDVFLVTAVGLVLAWGTHEVTEQLDWPPLWSAIAGIAVFGALYAIICWTTLLKETERLALHGALARRSRTLLGRQNQAA